MVKLRKNSKIHLRAIWQEDRLGVSGGKDSRLATHLGAKRQGAQLFKKANVHKVKPALNRDRLIQVNSQGVPIGEASKSSCHLNDGILHQAISVYLLDSAGQILIQKRSCHKLLWPGYWTNSYCSHPHPGESTLEAAQRRFSEELGSSVKLELREQFSYVYQARFHEIGSEYEYCTVFSATLPDDIKLNLRPEPAEVAEIKWMQKNQLSDLAAQSFKEFTPWFLLAWPRLVASNKLA